MRWCLFVSVGVLGGIFAWWKPTAMIVKHAIDMAQIIGVFAGLGLTAMSILATVPLERIVERARRTDHVLANALVSSLRQLPGRFKTYLTGQLISIAALLLLGLFGDELAEIIKSEARNDSLSCWRIVIGIVSFIALGVMSYCCWAAWETFTLLHKITEKAVERYKDIGLNVDAPASTIALKPQQPMETIPGTVVDPASKESTP